MNSRRIEDLHPYFQPIVTEVLASAPKRGLHPFIMQGKRSPEYQACLYAQGRMAHDSEKKFPGVVPTVTTKLRAAKVYVTCGPATNVVSFLDWHKEITWTLWSWHVLGFAVDLGFRSGPGKLDHWVGDLEKKKEWSLIDELYRQMNEVWLECVDGAVWGGSWKVKDRPHWEWHPGRSIEAVRAGKLPPYPQQCANCKAFRAALVAMPGKLPVCPECQASAYEPKCVGVR